MADQSYPIGLRNNLLTQEHYEIIGSAIWVYMWLYDRITEEYLAAGETRGRVLGGTVIKAREIAETFGISAATVCSHIRLLKVGRYITARQAGDGFQLEVRNSHKRSQHSSAPNPSSSSDSHGASVQEQQSSRVEEIPNSPTLESFNSRDVTLCNSREPSNKTLQLDQDIAEDIPGAAGEAAPTCEAAERWKLAASMSGRGKPQAYSEALERCRPLRIESGAVVVELPVQQPDRSRIESLMPTLRNALRMNTDTPLSLVMVDPNNEARAGPEVSTDAHGAAGP